ncbi:hypothetical protein SAMN04515665_1119 [Blastococcus sp. DSM 46786]|uniref:hypothetical protein n=1 Tax=Blastococcus sp. DSM 46786 TaxID=1798227 RepID=UPI0008B549FB|nr:hypothetical protein [Blastococcus sp. DSM 46786]SEL31054.1 hypothetical protein SAMN04515665_1119 [Blastococcus sp. DSM 46786]
MAKRHGEHPDVLHRAAQTAILTGLAGGIDDASELMLSVQPYDIRSHFTPDVALLEVAAAALGLACPPGSERLEYDGLTDRYLADLVLDGRTVRRRTQYAIYAAACMRGGLHPDLLMEAGSWEPKLWTYAVSAVVLYSRAAADHLGVPLSEVASRVAEELGLELPEEV